MMNRATVSAVSNGDIMQEDRRSAHTRLVNHTLQSRDSLQGLTAPLTLQEIHTYKWKKKKKLLKRTHMRICKHILSICMHGHRNTDKHAYSNAHLHSYCDCTAHLPDLQCVADICRVTTATQFTYICPVTAPMPTGHCATPELVSMWLKFDRAVKALLVLLVTAQHTQRPAGGTGEVNTGPI